MDHLWLLTCIYIYIYINIYMLYTHTSSASVSNVGEFTFIIEHVLLILIVLHKSYLFSNISFSHNIFTFRHK